MYERQVCTAVGVPIAALPAIKSNAEVYGHVKAAAQSITALDQWEPIVSHYSSNTCVLQNRRTMWQIMTVLDTAKNT